MCLLGKRAFIIFDTVFFSLELNVIIGLARYLLGTLCCFFFSRSPTAWRVSLNLLLSLDF